MSELVRDEETGRVCEMYDIPDAVRGTVDAGECARRLAKTLKSVADRLEVSDVSILVHDSIPKALEASRIFAGISADLGKAVGLHYGKAPEEEG